MKNNGPTRTQLDSVTAKKRERNLRLALVVISIATFIGIVSIGPSPLITTRTSGQVAPPCIPPPPDMVAWWPLDETTGATVVRDIAGFPNDGIPKVGPVGSLVDVDSPKARPGKVSGSLGFVPIPGSPPPHAHSNVQVSDHSDLNFSASESLTIDAWVKPVVLGTPGFFNHAIVSKVSGNSGYALLLPGGSQNTILRFWMNNNVFDSTDTMTFNEWHHVAVTVDRTTNEVTLYIDGAMDKDVAPTLLGAATTPVPLLIGGGQLLGPSQGEIDIDEVEIFKRALLNEEIQAIRNADFGKCKGCVPPPANMVAWCPADGNTFDITPSPLNGSLNGGATFASGEVGQGFSLNGTTAFVSALDAVKINFGTGIDFSIDAWIKTSNAIGIQSIIDKRKGNFPTLKGYHLFTSNGNLGVQLATGTFLNFISTKNVADGLFHHVAVTVDRNTAGMLYVDGIPVHPFNPTGHEGDLTNTAALMIGRRSPNTGTISAGFFKGVIDEVELFNRALLQPEVEAIFKRGSQGKCKCTITCPPDVTKPNGLNQCGAFVSYAPTASDGCGTPICSPPSTSFFPTGTTTVTCSTPANPSCTFTITVKDMQPPTLTCPNLTAETSNPCVVVSYAPVASDNCPGVGAVSCNPQSGHCFNIGNTTVTCTAADASGNTGTCSFTVGVNNSVFNVCLKAESNPSTVFLGNTITGAYRFCCGGTTFTGVASVTKRGNIATFQQNGPDRRVTATIDGGVFKGSASLQSPPGTTRCTIADRDTRNNNCVCQ